MEKEMEWTEENKLIDFLKNEKYKAQDYFFDTQNLHGPEHIAALENYERIAKSKLKNIDKSDTPLFERIIDEVDAYLAAFMNHADEYKTLLLKAIKKVGAASYRIVKNIDPSLKDDENFIFDAMKNSNYVFREISDRLKDDDDFILKLSDSKCFIEVEYLSDRLKNATRNNTIRAIGILRELQNDPDYLAAKASHQAKKALEIRQNIAINSQTKKKRFLFF